MRSLLSIIFASLCAALPALAQEAPHPADPELTALEQEILDDFLRKDLDHFSNGRRLDLNYNGRCDPQERALVLAVGAAIYHTRPGDLVDLALRDCPDREAFALHYRQTHPGPVKGQELRLAIKEEKALHDTASLLGLEEKGPWRERLKARLLEEEDTNRNGLLDHDELVLRGTTDRLLRRCFLRGVFCHRFDTNSNGMLEPGERLAVLNAVKEDLDLDGDGKVSVEELERLEVLPFSDWPEMTFPVPSRQRQLDIAKPLQPAYDRNGDGRWQLRELDEACRTEAALQEFAKTMRRPFSAETRDAFVKEFLACRDLNGNGRIDLVEIPRRPFLMDYVIPEYGPDPLDLLLWLRLSGNDPVFRLPETIKNDLWKPPFSLKRISQDPRIPPLLLVKCLNDILDHYDFNHNGRIDAEEAWAGLELEAFKGVLPGVFLCLEPAWIPKLVALYDRNHDGRLKPAEAFRLSETEKTWLLYRGWANLPAIRALDRNHDGWLDPEERQMFETEAVKRHDLDRDGMLNQDEIAKRLQEELCKQQLFGDLLTPAQQMEWDQTWALVRPVPGEPGSGFSLDCLSSMIFAAAPQRKATCQDIRDWHAFMLDHHDLNHDGRIDARELLEYRSWSNRWRDLAELRRLPATPASLPGLRQWALAHGDLDHNGQLTLLELESLRMTSYIAKGITTESNQDLFVLQKIDPEQATLAELTTIEAFASLIETLVRLHPEFDQDKNGTQDRAERLKFAQALLREGDRNGNGRLDYDESYRLLHQHHVTAEDATLIKRLEEEKRLQEMIRRQQEEQKRLEEEQKRRRQEEQRRQLEAQWLKKYDFNGNGKLDPEERTRAEADAKAGIQAPARDE